MGICVQVRWGFFVTLGAHDLTAGSGSSSQGIDAHPLSRAINKKIFICGLHVTAMLNRYQLFDHYKSDIVNK